MSDAKTPIDVTAASRFIDTVFRRHPEWAVSGAPRQPRKPGNLLGEFKAALGSEPEDATVMRVLRQFREREMARIGVRELSGLSTLDETLGDLSELAEVCSQLALHHALKLVEARFGQPRDGHGRVVRPVILGMGKLGGGELNFSSDIDLICLHTASGETDGANAIDNSEFFKRVVQQFTRLLSERTEHGFVFRVDLMQIGRASCRERVS
jgi:glutamate-ammonia-ligase adenylyltransferase